MMSSKRIDGDSSDGWPAVEEPVRPERQCRTVRSDHADKARSYFSGNGFKRTLEAVWKRYASLEKVAGNAVIRNANAEECEAINTFFGWNKKPGDDIRVPLEKLEQELLESAFPFTIVELHEVLTGEPLRTRSDRELLTLRDWQALFEAAKEHVADEGARIQPMVAEWLGMAKQRVTVPCASCGVIHRRMSDGNLHGPYVHGIFC